MGLRGHPDQSIFDYAEANDLVLLTGDVGLGNVHRFPLRTHPGIVVVRFPNEISNEVINEAVLGALTATSAQEIEGHVLIVEPGRVRLRRG